MDLSEPVFDYFSIGVSGSSICAPGYVGSYAPGYVYDGWFTDLYNTYRNNPIDYHSEFMAILRMEGWDDHR